jgi:hypothetical protein
MSDVLERLRAANPEPDPQAPSIEAVWRRIEQQSETNHNRRTGGAFSAGPRWVIPVASVLVALATAVLAVALLGHGRGATPRLPASVRALSAEFSVLESGQPPSAATQATLSQMLGIYGSYHPLPAFARRVESSNYTAAYLVPANRGLCVASASPSGSFCAPTGNIAGADVADLCSPTLPAGKVELAWLLPDHVTRITVQTTTGTRIRFPTGYNLYIADFSTPSSLPASIRWTDSTGHTHSGRAPVPPNAAAQRCAHPRSGQTTPVRPPRRAPRAPSAYCVNSITHKKTPCSPS